MPVIELTDMLSLASGAAVGLILGLIGGGGSILALPLMIYVVGVSDTHTAIGASALAVAVNAAISLAGHWRAGTVKWRCAGVFAAFGVVGAGTGSSLGKLTDGDLLLGLFGLLMIVVGAAMLRREPGQDDPDVALTVDTARHLIPRLGLAGLAVGVLSGFFGIGGGFLIVPGLIAATAMPMINAIGSSLVSVTALGATTAGNYALDGLVDWRLAGLFIAGGFLGSFAGVALASRLSKSKQALKLVFAVIVIGVGLFIAADGGLTLWGRFGPGAA